MKVSLQLIPEQPAEELFAAAQAADEHRDILGFEVRNDVGYGGMRWITVGPADQPGTSISGLPVRL